MNRKKAPLQLKINPKPGNYCVIGLTALIVKYFGDDETRYKHITYKRWADILIYAVQLFELLPPKIKKMLVKTRPQIFKITDPKWEPPEAYNWEDALEELTSTFEQSQYIWRLPVGFPVEGILSINDIPVTVKKWRPDRNGDDTIMGDELNLLSSELGDILHIRANGSIRFSRTLEIRTAK